MSHRKGGTSRREFLQQLAIFGAALSSQRCAWLESGPAPLELKPAPDPLPGPPLSADQVAALAASCERILPSEPGSPGAADAGVIEFAASELRRPELGEIRKRVVGGLLALDRRAARLRPGARFVDLGQDEQDRVLEETQRGSAQGEQFLRILISITLEGFLGDPSYGGNRNRVGWQVTGAAPTSERALVPARVVGAPAAGSATPVASERKEAGAARPATPIAPARKPSGVSRPAGAGGAR
ncbi:gluconate 2-dehydrogenase subunit 3 family protein [Vulgatibacter incomptus]|uniref:Gluconate 2-dehydrogenase n=1 Tax=Vulgatibacter incomptus TaxID=1391653 RepID=A0A0K1PF16_9BACT|nr:gluconate 2-dehydrogenase subunit 3 family protein [Vulgatibacter incomptus]AKU92123.1 Gluconate 2-dehydrogenase [Vulgatibacter incomptus]